MDIRLCSFFRSELTYSLSSTSFSLPRWKRRAHDRRTHTDDSRTPADTSIAIAARPPPPPPFSTPSTPTPSPPTTGPSSAAVSLSPRDPRLGRLLRTVVEVATELQCSCGEQLTRNCLSSWPRSRRVHNHRRRTTVAFTRRAPRRAEDDPRREGRNFFIRRKGERKRREARRGDEEGIRRRRPFRCRQDRQESRAKLDRRIEERPTFLSFPLRFLFAFSTRFFPFLEFRPRTFPRFSSVSARQWRAFEHDDVRTDHHEARRKRGTLGPATRTATRLAVNRRKWDTLVGGVVRDRRLVLVKNMELTTIPSTPLALTLALAILSTARRCDAVSESIIGSRETCDIEGEDFTVDKIPNTRCFNCICKNGFVECLKQQCPSTEGCYTLLDPLDNECCHRCKGCVRNGVYHDSDTEWTEGNDPCRIFTCKAGVITESRLRCYMPCNKPIPAAPGQCCPVCAGCFVNGQKVTADRSVTTTEDPCVTCRCNMGRLTCAKQACPVLHCSASKIIHDPGDCCPHCKGSGKFLSPPKGACMLGTTVYNTGSQFYVDECTRCTCSNSAISCIKDTCPVLECTSEHQMILPGRCCPQCPQVEESRASCTYGGRTYGDGESWKLDPCKACACMQGKVRCAMPMCPPMNLPCPPNSRLEHPEGQCCPRCVESDGVCTVFGDPHYRTFDGKFYSFKGACKYQLASDCLGHTFSIRVTNDARFTKSSAWTKTIAIKIGDLKVNLGQRMRVKVNGKKVNVPYRVLNRLEINRTIDSITVNTQIGIKVLWDGISFLEVSAPTSYRGRLCGLCGNFNSLSKDDFTTRRGRLLQDPQSFGQSWAVGAKKMCPRVRPSNNDREKRCKGRKDHRLCNRLRSQIFDACHKKVNPTMYYKACLQDMCECPTEHCYCESFMAYVHECQRLGIQLPHWRKATRCRTVWDQSVGSTGLGKRLR